MGSWSPVGTVQDRPSRQARRSLPLVLIERIAHVRGGGRAKRPSAWALISRLGVLVPSGDRPGPTEPAGETLAAARAHQEANSRARGLHPWQVTPVRIISSRARRRRVKVSSTFSKVAGGAGARWAPSSARSPLPRRSVLDVCHWQTAPEAAAEKGQRPTVLVASASAGEAKNVPVGHF